MKMKCPKCEKIVEMTEGMKTPLVYTETCPLCGYTEDYGAA